MPSLDSAFEWNHQSQSILYKRLRSIQQLLSSAHELLSLPETCGEKDNYISYASEIERKCEKYRNSLVSISQEG